MQSSSCKTFQWIILPHTVRRMPNRYECVQIAQSMFPHSPSHLNYVYCKLHSVKCNIACRNCFLNCHLFMNFCFCFVLLCFVSSMYCLLSWEYTFLVYYACQAIRCPFSHPRFREVCVSFCSPCIVVEKKKKNYRFDENRIFHNFT